MIALTVLAALIAYVVFALFYVSKKKGWKSKAIWLLVFALIPTWDSLIGKVYFSYLCSSQSGIFVYEKVKLGDDFYISPELNSKKVYGINLDFLTKENGLEVNKDKFFERYIKSKVGTDIENKGFGVSRFKTDFVDAKTSRILGEAISFSRQEGGWIFRNLGLKTSTENCDFDKNGNLIGNINLVKRIFYDE